jgi:hypothetical protein
MASLDAALLLVVKIDLDSELIKAAFEAQCFRSLQRITK